MTAINASMIIGSWTAFEALAADLWEQSLNSYPALAFVALGANVDANETEEEAERKRKSKFTVPNWFVQEQGLNFSDKMGTFLRTTGKWDFQRLGGIEDGYRKVFVNSEGELKRIFADESLKWLSAVRNAFVHRGGKADEQFCRQVRKHAALSAVSNFGAAVNRNAHSFRV
jgi:hypothetical protein